MQESPGRCANPNGVSETTAVRTLVKSAPEVWAACSDAEALARHLGAFGEIKITRLEPESTVAWEGERASGTVTIEPSNWGTKVTMTATLADAVEARPVVEVEPVTAVEPVTEVEPVTAGQPATGPEPFAAVPPRAPQPAPGARRPGLLARLAALFGLSSPPPPVAMPDPEPPQAVPEPEPDPEPEVVAQPLEQAGTDPEAALDAALDSLGQAHHRPFSQF